MIEGARDCFIIMPYKLKQGTIQVNEAKVDLKIDFDAVLAQLIEPAISAAGLEPKRGDKFGGGNIIYNTMFAALAEFPYALFDATFLNANVYYEVGVRHALNRCVTIAIQADGTAIPFDVQGVPFFKYRVDDDGRIADLPATVERLAAHIKECVLKNETDSPVFNSLDGMKVEWKRGGRIIQNAQTIEYDVAGNPDFKIGVKTGNLQDIKDVDAWVNSENDHMQMARVIEKSISATIRYLGAEVDRNGDVRRDRIAEELRRKVGDVPRVSLGSVYDTGPGRLRRTHNVKRLFHAATVQGVAGEGFVVGPEINRYVAKAIDAVDEYNRRPGIFGRDRVDSMLVPLFGAGHARKEPEHVTDLLLSGALQGVGDLAKRNRPSGLSRIYFLAFSTRDLYPLDRSFQKRLRSGELAGRVGPAAEAII